MRIHLRLRVVRCNPSFCPHHLYFCDDALDSLNASYAFSYVPYALWDLYAPYVPCAHDDDAYGFSQISSLPILHDGWVTWLGLPRHEEEVTLILSASAY